MAWAERQAIVGVLFRGIDKLGNTIKIPFPVLMEWIGKSNLIEQQNKLLNRRCKELIDWFCQNGYKSCILKGQGNLFYYPNPNMRTPGDIDIWVDGNDKNICKYVKERYRNAHFQYHHIDFPIFKDVPVEIHYRPSFLNNFVYNARLQSFFYESAEEQFNNKVTIPDLGEICVPTYRFNCVFQLSHMQHHYFDSGIGLRQMIDYYYILSSNKDAVNKEEWINLLRYLGLLKFAKGVMWIQKHVLGLDEKYLLVDEDIKIGRKILKVVIIGGNFGRYNLENKLGASRYRRVIVQCRQNMDKFFDFPSETMCRPLFIIWHQWWKWQMNMRIC